MTSNAGNPSARPAPVAGVAFGGDYNPEQWPEEVWHEDVRLMTTASVDLVSVGIFSWALLEPSDGTFDFGWLDRILDLLHAGGIRVDLATATASPPPWLARAHPQLLPRTAEGATMWPGGRQAFCPSSPVYREHATRLARALAERYRDHPALAMWHVSNEIGCHNAHCYCDVSAAAFRVWLQARYGTVEALNEAWGTTFWSQRYGDWKEILPPRLVSYNSFANPTQQLDFHRFSSDELLHNFRIERDVLHEVTPGVPVTTNFMVMNMTKNMDYFAWAPEMDVVSNDHYMLGEDPHAHIELAFSADLTRGVAGGKPWLLMEHSTSAVNWQRRNIAKSPGQLARNSLAHVARGADGVLFFQWRAAKAGAEKFHSALLPHAGEDTKVFREVTDLGAALDRLDEVAGSTVRGDVAIVFDWQNWWAVELDSHPSADVTAKDQPEAWYRTLWEAGVTVDVVHPEADLSGYRVVIVPTLYLVTDAAAANLTTYAEGGGTLLVTYFSGIVDRDDHIRLGGYPGAFRDAVGVRVEEFFPLRAGETVALSDGTDVDVWTEWMDITTAQAVHTFASGPLAGRPAVTRNDHGSGTAWYVGTRLSAPARADLLRRVLSESGVSPAAEVPAGVEVVRRTGPDASWLFVLNHTDDDVDVTTHGHELLRDRPVDGLLTVAAGDVAVIRERST